MQMGRLYYIISQELPTMPISIVHLYSSVCISNVYLSKMKNPIRSEKDLSNLPFKDQQSLKGFFIKFTWRAKCVCLAHQSYGSTMVSTGDEQSTVLFCFGGGLSPTFFLVFPSPIVFPCVVFQSISTYLLPGFPEHLPATETITRSTEIQTNTSTEVKSKLFIK